MSTVCLRQLIKNIYLTSRCPQLNAGPVGGPEGRSHCPHGVDLQVTVVWCRRQGAWANEGREAETGRQAAAPGGSRQGQEGHRGKRGESRELC